jgi:serine/threonine protein kinase
VVTNNNELLGQALGTCTIRRLIGRGGMGTVYLAQQSRPRRTVAVKVLMPGNFLDQQPRAEFLVRFRREADAVAALDHVHIMPVYEYGEQGDYAYLVMPYVTGGTLRQLIEKRGRLTLKEAVPIIEQAAAALDSAHAQGIIHRDLKPGNILFHADGRVLLADFGLAKMINDAQGSDSNGPTALTSAGAIIGTPEYLSPEQGMGKTIDHRTDIYSLGIVLYHMLAGHVPFQGSTPVAVAIKHALEEPPSLVQANPDIPASVEAVTRKAIAKNPDDRYPSAGEFAHALREAANGLIPEQNAKKAAYSSYETINAQPIPPSTGDNERTVHPQQGEVRLQGAGEGTQLPGFNAAPTEAMPPTPQAPLPSAPPQGQPGPQQPESPNLEPRVLASTHKAPPFVNLPASRPTPAALSPAYRGDQPAPLGRRPSVRMMLLAGLLVLVVIVGGLASLLYLTRQPSGGPQTGAPSTATTGAGTGSTPRKSGSPPTPAISVGNLIYHTTYPGPNCDGSGAKWTATQGANLQCNSGGLRMNNVSSGTRAGVILTSLNGGASLPADYVVQVQATVNSDSNGAFGILFFVQSNPDQGAHIAEFDLNKQIMIGHYVPLTNQNSQPVATAPIPQSGQTVTLDVVVHGDNPNSGNVDVYVDGNGGFKVNATDLNPASGTTGLTVAPGADVTFKDLAIYSPAQ